MKAYKKLLMPLIMMAVFVSCDELGNDEMKSGKASLEVKLTDAPADYDAVHIDVQDVLIRYQGNDTSWIELQQVESGIYDLLELTGGADTLLATSEVDTGMISEIRLILGENNSLVMNGDSISLTTPSAQQSGLKIKLNEQLIGGNTYNLMLDFDAAKSIVKAGNSGKYILKPVIRAFFETDQGAISGAIADSVQAVVYALDMDETDSIGTYTNGEGEFLIQGLEAGGYNVVIEPDTLFNDTTIQDVTVDAGGITTMGHIELERIEE